MSDLILANKAAQEHLAEVEESKAAMEKELREKISKLEKELESANDLLSATKRKGGISWHLKYRNSRAFMEKYCVEFL